MSDLQCAATLLLWPVESAASLRRSAPALVADRVAAVQSADAAAAGEVGAEAARLLRVPASTLDGLDRTTDLVGFRTALADLADAHRGETVLVVLPRGVMDRWVPAACGLAAGARVPTGVARVRVDADAWVLDAWPGDTVTGSDG